MGLDMATWSALHGLVDSDNAGDMLDFFGTGELCVPVLKHVEKF